MSRPLIQHRVGQLEELFVREKANRKILLQLKEELTHRQVPRAVALLGKVQRILNDLDSPEGSPRISPPAIAPTEPAVSRQESEVIPDLFSGDFTAPVAPEEVQPQVSAIPAMSATEAYRILGVSAGASWESIETARRNLVQKAYPSKVQDKAPAERNRIVFEAKRANTAYALIQKLRVALR